MYAGFLPGPTVPDAARMWSALGTVLSLDRAPTDGDRVCVAVEGIEPADGVVEFAAHDTFVCVSVPDALYMFVHGFDGTTVVEYHGFGGDGDAVQAAWENWLLKSFV